MSGYAPPRNESAIDFSQMVTTRITLIAVGLLIVSCDLFAQDRAPISFLDVSAASNINVPNISTPESRYIIESMSGGSGSVRLQ